MCMCMRVCVCMCVCVCVCLLVVINQEGTIQGIEKFDQGALKHTEPVVPTPIFPDKGGNKKSYCCFYLGI